MDLHQELRSARENAGLSQQALADRAGIPRNQIVRAERGENITIDTLRKIAAHLPLNELTLMDTTAFRVDIIPEPEKLFEAAMENVLRLVDALAAALRLAGEAHTAVEVARRSMDPPPPPRRADGDPVFFLRGLERLSHEVVELAREAKLAS
jgi:transcriptional regulator with XRE-family HTH domain